tara:strand:- start:25 stop:591 length:567 start_codon:yes stop_codon:yes gene_type:complete
MKKNTDVVINKNKITVVFNKLINNQIITLEFTPLNKYQLTCTKISVTNMSKSLHINSTDLRKINIHNLVKTAIKLIDKNIKLEPTKYKKIGAKYLPTLNNKDLIQIINKKSYKNRDELLSVYSLLYTNLERDFGSNISEKISKKVIYKESYVKNLTKECFQGGFLSNSKPGLAGGILSNKSLKNLSYF